MTHSTEARTIADVDAASLLLRNRIPNNCLVYRRNLVADIRHLTDIRTYEDWDFLLACLPGRTLTHVPINSVAIRKSPATAPDMETRLARQALLASSSIELGLENF